MGDDSKHFSCDHKRLAYQWSTFADAYRDGTYVFAVLTPIWWFAYLKWHEVFRPALFAEPTVHSSIAQFWPLLVIPCLLAMAAAYKRRAARLRMRCTSGCKWRCP